MECDRAEAGKGLRQGDIFAAHPGTPNWADPWKRFGVVLSADCDLAQGKTGPNVVYAPVVGWHTYLSDVWLPNQAQKLASEALARAERLLARAGSGSKLSEALDGDDELLKELFGRLDPDTEREKHTREFVGLRRTITELNACTSPPDGSRTTHLQVHLTNYLSHFELLKGGRSATTEQRRKHLVTALRSIADRDRVDTWPILDLVGLDPEMRDEENSGFVIDLRRFSVVPVTLVVTERGEWLRNHNSYFRICRLRGTYKADLMQRFANLFVRVGLEDAREEEQERLFGLLAKRLVPEVVT